MREVIPLDVADFITSKLRDQWADTVVNARVAALRTFFDFLHMGGVVNIVPPRFIRPRWVTKKIPRCWVNRKYERYWQEPLNCGIVPFWSFSMQTVVDKGGP